MEILNPTTKKIKDRHEYNKSFLSFMKNGTAIHFSKAAMKNFCLKPEMLITFVIDLDRLYFYISKEEGFVLKHDRHDSGAIFSKLLVRHIYSRLPESKRNGTRYLIRASNTRISECITFEVILDKRL